MTPERFLYWLDGALAAEEKKVGMSYFNKMIRERLNEVLEEIECKAVSPPAHPDFRSAEFIPRDKDHQ